MDDVIQIVAWVSVTEEMLSEQEELTQLIKSASLSSHTKGEPPLTERES